MFTTAAKLPARLLGVAWGLFALNVFLPWFHTPSAAQAQISVTLAIVANALAFISALRLALSKESPVLAWGLWAAQLGYLLGMRGLRAAFPGVKGWLPELPWGKPHHLLSYALVIAAFLVWGSLRRTRAPRAWLLLEDLLFASGGFFLVWVLGLREYVGHFQVHGVTLALLVGILASAALNAGLWASLFLRPPPGDGRRLAWIGLGLVTSLGRNAMFSLALSQGWPRLFQAVHAWDPFTWLCWAQAFQTPRGPAMEIEAQDEGILRAYLPYLPAAASMLLIIILLAVDPGRLDAQTMALWVPVMVLLFWRQGLVMRETRQQARTLEAQVAERTRSLEEAQGLLLQTERMNTMASLGAGLAHDLNNLIGVSKNYAELVEQDILDGTPPDLRDVERIKASATRAGELTAQLMAFGRQQPPRPEGLDLAAHLESRQGLYHMVVRAPAELHLDPPRQPLTVGMEASAFDQLILNLLSNAKDALPHGGRVQLRCATEGSWALIEVADEGTGMSEETRQRIFDPFFSTKEPGKGTGLGLASVKTLVEQAEGSIEVESALGRGTTFRIRLPLSNP